MKKIGLIIFFLTFSGTILGQKIDSISLLKESYSQKLSDSSQFKITTKIAKLFYKNNNDSAKYYYQKAYEIALKSKRIELELPALKNLGLFEFRNISYTNAITYFNKALQICKINCDKKQEAKIYYYLGYSYMYLYDENKSFENFIKSLNICKSNNDAKGIAENYSGIGALFYDQHNYEFAQKYYTDALNINLQLKDSSNLASNYIDLGNALADNGKLNEGMAYYKKSIEILLVLKDDVGVGISYNNISDTYKELKKYDEAKHYLNKALKLAEKENNKNLLAIVYLNRATIENILNNNSLAIKYALKSNIYADEVKQLNYKAENFKILSKAYKSQGNFKKAFFYNEKYISINDSLNKFDKHKTAQLFKSLNELEESNSRIDKLAIENDRVKIKNKNEKKFIYGLIIAMTIFALLIVLLIYQYTKKQEAFNLLKYQNFRINEMHDEIEKQKNHLEKLNKGKDKLFSIIGHDLKNPINSIKGFSDLLLENCDTYSEEKNHKFLKIISNSTKKASELLNSLLMWANAQSDKIELHPEKIELNELISNIISLLEAQAFSKNIKIKTHFKPDTFINADKNMTRTVIRNLISNAIKFTKEDGLIAISTKDSKNGVELEIKDNGVGMSKEDLKNLFSLTSKKTTNGTANEQGSGLGLLLVKEFVEKNNGKITVESELNKGSIFRITFLKYVGKVPKPKDTILS